MKSHLSFSRDELPSLERLQRQFLNLICSHRVVDVVDVTDFVVLLIFVFASALSTHLTTFCVEAQKLISDIDLKKFIPDHKADFVLLLGSTEAELYG